ncbi:hypothetical protein PMAYCL1PPCAC_30182, partial [Pristionchus mayeri]
SVDLSPREAAVPDVHTRMQTTETKRRAAGGGGGSWMRSHPHPAVPIAITVFLLMAVSGVEAIAEGQNLRANMVAEHSRRTFRTHDPNMMNFANPMVDEIAASISSRLDMDEFVASTRETLEEEEEDYFREIWYDRNTTKIHNICEENRSGPAKMNLTWSEPGDLLLKIVGNGVVKGGYNMFMAPGQAKGRETKIHVALYIESMSSFKAQTMDFEVDTYLAMGWFDRRLAHNCSYPILVTSKVISDRIWQPDLYFVNSKFAYLQEVTTPNMMVIVYPDGLVFKSMRIDVTLSCSMELKRFPMDTQRCPVTVQSYAYVEELVNLTWFKKGDDFPLGVNTDIRLNDMVITRKEYESCSNPYPMFRGQARWSCIRAFIVMRRLVLFHIIQTYIPTGMLVVISWMSFWLDPRASPARISLTITSLLTLTTMSNGARQDLPQVSYIKALDIWLTFSQGLIFLVLLEYSFVSFYMTKRSFDCVHRRAYQHKKLRSSQSFNSKSEEDRPEVTQPQSIEEIPFRKPSSSEYDEMIQPPSIHLNGVKHRNSQSNGHPPYSLSQGLSKCANNAAALMSATPHAAAHIYNKFDFTKPCQKCSLNNERIAKKIDHYSRMIFPTTFILFCTIYWAYYTYTEDTVVETV